MEQQNVLDQPCGAGDSPWLFADEFTADQVLKMYVEDVQVHVASNGNQIPILLVQYDGKNKKVSCWSVKHEKTYKPRSLKGLYLELKVVELSGKQFFQLMKASPNDAEEVQL